MIKQSDSTSDMIFRIPRLIEHISSIMTLQACFFALPPLNFLTETTELQEGDLILTGTPKGVGPVQPGDQVECALLGPNDDPLLTLDFKAEQRQGGYQFQEKDT